jgi:uncharacterized protein YggE
MRRVQLSLMIAVALLFAATPSASAQGASEGKMRILGRGTVAAVPDQVTVRVGITNKAATPTAALDQNSAVARKIIDFAKQFGVADRDIQTDSINLAPAYRSVQEPGGRTRQEPDGYTAGNMVRVKLTDMSRLGIFMRQVLDQGATNINGVHFGLSNPEKFVDEARTKAVEDAVHQARLLAAAAKVKLGSIQEIVHPPRTEFRDGSAAADLRRPVVRTAVPVEVGVVEIHSEVDITWRIE